MYSAPAYVWILSVNAHVATNEPCIFVKNRLDHAGNKNK